MIFAAGSTYAQKKQFGSDNLLHVAQPQKTFPFQSKNLDLDKPAFKSGLFLSPNFYSLQLGFFCKQEIKFEKATKLPLKFRLGSVATCDYLEGKRRH